MCDKKQEPGFFILIHKGYPFPGVQLLMHFQPMNCKHLQGAADVRRRAHRRTFVLQVLGNKADAVPCECLPQGNNNAG